MYLRQAKSAMEQPRNRLILSGCGQIPVEELYNSAIFRGSLAQIVGFLGDNSVRKFILRFLDRVALQPSCSMNGRAILRRLDCHAAIGLCTHSCFFDHQC